MTIPVEARLKYYIMLTNLPSPCPPQQDVVPDVSKMSESTVVQSPGQAAVQLTEAKLIRVFFVHVSRLAHAPEGS
jgi:hypothetical protein